MSLVLAGFVPAASGCAEEIVPRDASRGIDARTDVQMSFDTSVSRPDVPPVCGDGICVRDLETCMNCPLDCMACPRCDLAPSCTGALAVPTATTAIDSCNNTTSTGTQRTNYACGIDLGVPPSETTCADPKLRIRIRDVTIQRGWFDVPSNLYCVVSAEDGMHSELVLTPPRSVAGNKNTTVLNFRPSEGIVWGKSDLYRSISNITITYACYLTTDASAAQRVLDDISGRAIMAAASADGYGWVFGAVAVLGTVIGSSLSSIRDTQVLDVQQTIASGALLNLTNARSWQIRSSHGNLDLSGVWDLKMTMESWGCADVRPRPL